MCVGYVGQNGYVYYVIGCELIDCGVLMCENVLLQMIRVWFEENFDEVEVVMVMNWLFVFFCEIKGEGFFGLQGVVFMLECSFVVDCCFLLFGVLVFFSVEYLMEDGEGIEMLWWLFIVQDIGGVICGLVCGDVFWGVGECVEEIVGCMKYEGKFFLFFFYEFVEWVLQSVEMVMF